MTRYIDADALREQMFNYYDCVNEGTCKGGYSGQTLMDYEVADLIRDCIENAPTADVMEVVMCRDCEKRYTDECPMYHVEEILWDDDGWTEIDHVVNDLTNDDGFCDKWERRKEDVCL